ncbi:DUF459 domain-containing protein [Rhizobium sp. BK376]|uniref:SGNH/GDSL hydrolase family protein n=1 Tax=Rhizobium sp. BK376 TaxID=2512149 RepID=UPI0010487C75|nr:DUF459 domain-containing protein [Rhizobium sp. BK376]TCR91573.1 hypothetical protein EV561_10214 [Rhizobium sp. BK376]
MNNQSHRMTRVAAARAIAAALLALCFAFVGLAMPAEAQQPQQQRRTLLEMLFGRRVQEPYYYAPAQQAPRRMARPPRKKAAPASPPRQIVTQPDEPPPAEKLDTAQKILVVGDFLAGGLGSGLDDAFSNSPGVVIDTRGNVASGLVRQDYYNWPQQLPQMIDQVKPAIVVVMIGSNDRQQMIGDGLNEKFGTDAWYMAYEERVQDFAKLVTDRHIPLLWVGLPSFGSDSMTADVVKLNQIYQSKVTSIGGEFINIWDGFTDENGDFVITGSDINGQQVRLRTADGINMTAAGRRKVAFYVEKSARRLLGDQASPDITRLDTDNAAINADLPPSEVNQPLRTQPISLSDPNLDGGAELLGAAISPAPSTQSPRDLLVEKGEMAPAPAGRVDDYRLKRAAP